VIRPLFALVRLVLVLALFGLATAATATALGPTVVEVADSVTFEGVDVVTRGLATRSKVYDVNGQLLRTLQGEENRELVTLDDIPEEVVEAVLAIEDADFYRHRGVNVKATLRAAVENVGAGGISQGGSTITQQVIKNLVLTSEQTLARKVEEASLAVQLEQQMEKDEILELYLNTVYFGNGAYGVQAAAETYWGLDAEDLGWEQAALLAGMIANPSDYDPINRSSRASTQRAIVLNRLATLGLISEDDARFLKRTPLPAERRGLDLVEEDFFMDQVLQLLLGEATNNSYDTFALGNSSTERINAVYRGGLRVFTTYDKEAQDMAEAAKAEVLPDNNLGVTIAMAAIEPSTGAVKAIVGGGEFDRENDSYNIAVRTPGRQPGSSFKTFVLVAALENGYTPNDTISGVGECRFPDPFAEGGVYKVNNFGNSTGSIDTLTNQTLRSSNCTYVRLGRIVGLDNVVDVAGRLGVTSQLDAVTSLPLGVEEIPPIEMATAYATIVNGGIRNDPYFIERIETAEGEILYQHSPRSRRVINEDVACWTTEVLEQNVVRGTGTRAQIPGQPAGGKTGTTEDFGDAWFVGFTPHLATAVWMGHPDGNTIKMRAGSATGLDRNVTGGSYPAMTWGAFNVAYHEDLAPVPFDECGPYTRGSRNIRDDGSFGSDHPCSNTAWYPVDYGNDGRPDQCMERPEAFGFQVCSYTGSVDQFGQQVPLYCQNPNATPTEGTTGGIVDGEVVQPAPGEVVVTPGCIPAYPVGRDEDGDGVIDRCFQA